jgi:hypothetical protein
MAGLTRWMALLDLVTKPGSSLNAMSSSNHEENNPIDGPETGYQNQNEETVAFGARGASSSTHRVNRASAADCNPGSDFIGADAS